MEDMAQSLEKDGVAWMKDFPQGLLRMEADGGLHKAIIRREFQHLGDTGLRMCVMQAGVKTDEENDTKMRIIKREASSKVDVLVGTSMARHICAWLNI
jgi:phage terminase large subunit-like protein